MAEKKATEFESAKVRLTGEVEKLTLLLNPDKNVVERLAYQTKVNEDLNKELDSALDQQNAYKLEHDKAVFKLGNAEKALSTER